MVADTLERKIAEKRQRPSLQDQGLMNHSHSARIDPKCRDEGLLSQVSDGNSGNNGSPLQ